MADSGLLGSTKDSVWVNLVEDGTGEIQLTSGGSKKIKTPSIAGEVVQVTNRPLVPYGQTDPEVFDSGDIRREILVNLDVDGVEHVLPIKESSDLHKKLKEAAKTVQAKALEDLVGLRFSAKVTGRGKVGKFMAKLHEVTLS